MDVPRVTAIGGANMRRIQREIVRIRQDIMFHRARPVDIIVVWAGICDIMQKDRHGNISVRSEGLEECFRWMARIYSDLHHEKINRSRDTVPHVMFATIAPVSLYYANSPTVLYCC